MSLSPPARLADRRVRAAGRAQGDGVRGASLRKRGSDDAWLSHVELDSSLNPRLRGWSTPAGKRLAVRIGQVPPGPFDPTRLVDNAAGWLGLLVVDGLALVQVAAGRA